MESLTLTRVQITFSSENGGNEERLDTKADNLERQVGQEVVWLQSTAGSGQRQPAGQGRCLGPLGSARLGAAERTAPNTDQREASFLARLQFL